MHFVRELGVKVTCLHEGSVLAEGSLDFVSRRPACHRSLSGEVRVLIRVFVFEFAAYPPLHYGGSRAGAANGVSLRSRSPPLWGRCRARCTCVLKRSRNGVGKTTRCPGVARISLGRSRSPRARRHGISLEGAITGQHARPAPSDVRSRPVTGHRIGYVPQGREIFPLLTVQGKPRNRLRAASSADRGRYPTTIFSSSRCCNPCSAGAAGTCPAASSSSSPSAGRW
jgi:hypothetical protein